MNRHKQMMQIIGRCLTSHDSTEWDNFVRKSSADRKRKRKQQKTARKRNQNR